MAVTNSNGNRQASRSPFVQNAWLRRLGFLVFSIGIGAAALVYWFGTRSPNLSDDPSMTGYSKLKERQMETMYGKMGTLTDDLFDGLKRPGVQAFIITGISTLVAAGCFYFARPEIDSDDEG